MHPRCTGRIRLTYRGWAGGARPQSGGADDELCAMFDESSQCTIVLPEEGLGYGLVVPFPAYGFAALVSHNENLNSPKQGATDRHRETRDLSASYVLLPAPAYLHCPDKPRIRRSSTYLPIGYLERPGVRATYLVPQA